MKRSSVGFRYPADVPTISVASAYQEVQAGGAFTVEVTRSGNLSYTSRVRAYTVAGTANTNDYAPLDGSVIEFAPNETTKTVTINTFFDFPPESYEEFSFVIANPEFAKLGTSRMTLGVQPSEVLVNITVQSITVSDITEGDDVVFTVTLSQAVPVGQTRDIFIARRGTVPSQFLSGPLYSNGVTVKPKNVGGSPIVVPAGVSTFTVTYQTNTGAAVGSYGTIDLQVGLGTASSKVYPDVGPTLSVVQSISAPTTIEGGTLSFLVTLNNATQQQQTFTFSAGGSVNMIAGVDYSTTLTLSNQVLQGETTLTVPAGVSSFTVGINTYNDAFVEGTESIFLNIGGINATGTVIDDDGAQVSVTSVSSQSVVEGATLVYGVVLSGTTSQPTVFTFDLGGNASASVDYVNSPSFTNGVTLGSGNITVPAGVASFAVNFSTINESIQESSETLVVTIGGVSGTGTILDDDSSFAPNASRISGNPGNDSYYLNSYNLINLVDRGGIIESTAGGEAWITEGGMISNMPAGAAGQILIYFDHEVNYGHIRSGVHKFISPQGLTLSAAGIGFSNVQTQTVNGQFILTLTIDPQPNELYSKDTTWLRIGFVNNKGTTVASERIIGYHISDEADWNAGKRFTSAAKSYFQKAGYLRPMDMVNSNGQNIQWVEQLPTPETRYWTNASGRAKWHFLPYEMIAKMLIEIWVEYGHCPEFWVNLPIGNAFVDVVSNATTDAFTIIKDNGQSLEAGRLAWYVKQNQPLLVERHWKGANSTTSNTIGTGTKVFTLNPADFAINDRVFMQDNANSANRMRGVVTAKDSTTVTINVTSFTGSGTSSNWRVNIDTPTGINIGTVYYADITGDTLRLKTSAGSSSFIDITDVGMAQLYTINDPSVLQTTILNRIYATTHTVNGVTYNASDIIPKYKMELSNELLWNGFGAFSQAFCVERAGSYLATGGLGDGNRGLAWFYSKFRKAIADSNIPAGKVDTVISMQVSWPDRIGQVLQLTDTWGNYSLNAPIHQMVNYCAYAPYWGAIPLTWVDTPGTVFTNYQWADVVADGITSDDAAKIKKRLMLSMEKSGAMVRESINYVKAFAPNIKHTIYETGSHDNPTPAAGAETTAFELLLNVIHLGQSSVDLLDYAYDNIAVANGLESYTHFITYGGWNKPISFGWEHWGLVRGSHIPDTPLTTHFKAKQSQVYALSSATNVVTAITNNGPVNEGSTLTFTLTIANQASTVRLPIDVTGSANKTDYGDISGTNGVIIRGKVIHIPAGITSSVISVPILDDPTLEAPENIVLTIGNLSSDGSINASDGYVAPSYANIASLVDNGVPRYPDIEPTVGSGQELNVSIPIGGGYFALNLTSLVANGDFNVGQNLTFKFKAKTATDQGGAYANVNGYTYQLWMTVGDGLAVANGDPLSVATQTLILASGASYGAETTMVWTNSTAVNYDPVTHKLVMQVMVGGTENDAAHVYGIRDFYKA